MELLLVVSKERTTLTFNYILFGKDCITREINCSECRLRVTLTFFDTFLRKIENSEILSFFPILFCLAKASCDIPQHNCREISSGICIVLTSSDLYVRFCGYFKGVYACIRLSNKYISVFKPSA